MQFITYSRKTPELKACVDKEHGYYRLECSYLPENHETAEQLRNVADQLDAIIEHYEPKL